MIAENALDFDEEEHIYTRNDKEYKSVTTFVKEFFSKFDAEAVAQSKAYSYGKYKDKSKEEILEMWRQKADDGTEVHKQIEDWLRGKELAGWKPRAKQGRKYWLSNIREEYFIHDVWPELRVYHDKYKLAGTVDVVFKHNSKGKTAKHQVTLVDWKTNKAIYKSPYKKGSTGTHEITENIPDCNWHHYSLQLSLYAFILEDQFDQNIYKLNLVHLKQDDYKVYDVPYRKELVKKLCESM